MESSIVASNSAEAIRMGGVGNGAWDFNLLQKEEE